MAKKIETLGCMSGHLNGAHWGVSDWYPEIEAGIKEALAKGTGHNWTTGWYGSKKEIASARITHKNGVIVCEAGVSDDFDTPGRGKARIRHTTDIRRVQKAVDLALDRAGEDKRDNEPYKGFSVLTLRDNYAFILGGVPQGEPVRSLSWVETLILPFGDGRFMDGPPGDYYDTWGFQGECELPDEVKHMLRTWAEEWMVEGGDLYPESGDKEFTYGGYVIRPWDEQE